MVVLNVSRQPGCQYRCFLDVPPLCDGLAVPLVRHFHPLHRRHVSALRTGLDQEDGEPGTTGRRRRRWRRAGTGENVPREENLCRVCFRVVGLVASE